MISEYLVYPRLKRATANKLAQELGLQPISELQTEYEGNNRSVIYATTGSRVQISELRQIQIKVRECASAYGYPSPDNVTDAAYGEFDARCAELLHQSMRLFPAEAAYIEMWAFITCVLLPDIVRWRFYGVTTAQERFIGFNRGLRRNALGRLWWRAYLLCQPAQSEPYQLLYKLGEDELVQITERANIAKNPILVGIIAQVFLNTLSTYPELPRRDLMREAVKRILRLISLISFEALDEVTVTAIIEKTFNQTAQAIMTKKQTTTKADL
ncbi:MAG: hypothetical protein OHK0046_36890 [Anaerolineae bacterium]